MSQLSKSQIETELQRIAKLIGAEPDQLPTVCNSQDFARPNIEVAHNGIVYYEAYEQGEQLFSIPAYDLEHLMYMSFNEITFEMATQFELRNRKGDKDFRRLLFGKQTELMETINPEWAERIKEEIDGILKSSPFED